MNDGQAHAFPSDPAGYQPQQGLTKREYLEFLILAAIMGEKDPGDARNIGHGINTCIPAIAAARITAETYFTHCNLPVE